MKTYLYKITVQDDGSSALRRVTSDSKKAEKNLLSVGSAADKTAEKFSKMKGLVYGGAGIVAGAGLARLGSDIMNTGSSLDMLLRQIKNVSAATPQEFNRITKTVRELGATTEKTSIQSAEALLFLNKTGFSVEQGLSSLYPLLNLTTAGVLDLGSAADISSNILKMFGLDVSQLTELTDYMLATTNRANVDFYQLAESVKYAGSSFHAFGFDPDDLFSIVGKLGDVGIQGSMAGTQLNAAISKVSSVGKGLGLGDFYARTGENASFEYLLEMLEEMNRQGWNPDDILKAFTVRGSRAVISLKDNIGEIRKLNQEILNARGEVERNASFIRQSYDVQLSLVKSAFESVEIDVFNNIQSEFIGAFKGIVNWIDYNRSTIVDFFSIIGKSALDLSHVIVSPIENIVTVITHLDKSLQSFAGRKESILDADKLISAGLTGVLTGAATRMMFGGAAGGALGTLAASTVYLKDYYDKYFNDAIKERGEGVALKHSEMSDDELSSQISFYEKLIGSSKKGSLLSERAMFHFQSAIAEDVERQFLRDIVYNKSTGEINRLYKGEPDKIQKIIKYRSNVDDGYDDSDGLTVDEAEKRYSLLNEKVDDEISKLIFQRVQSYFPGAEKGKGDSIVFKKDEKEVFDDLDRENITAYENALKLLDGKDSAAVLTELKELKGKEFDLVIAKQFSGVIPGFENKKVAMREKYLNDYMAKYEEEDSLLGAVEENNLMALQRYYQLTGKGFEKLKDQKVKKWIEKYSSLPARDARELVTLEVEEMISTKEERDDRLLLSKLSKQDNVYQELSELFKEDSVAFSKFMEARRNFLNFQFKDLPAEQKKLIVDGRISSLIAGREKELFSKKMKMNSSELGGIERYLKFSGDSDNIGLIMELEKRKKTELRGRYSNIKSLSHLQKETLIEKQTDEYMMPFKQRPVEDRFGSLYSNMDRFKTGIMNANKEVKTLGDTWEQVGGQMNGYVGSYIDAVGSAIFSTKSWDEAMRQWGANTAQQLLSAITKAIVLNSLMSLSSFGTPSKQVSPASKAMETNISFAPVDKSFAFGGILNEEVRGLGQESGQIYRFGEAGQEAFIPLGNIKRVPSKQRRGSTSIVNHFDIEINVENTGVEGEGIPVDAFDQLEEKLQGVVLNVMAKNAGSGFYANAN